MRKVVLFIMLLFNSNILMGADLHHQTTADSVSLYMTVHIGDEDLTVNLESPGLVIRKYPGGYLKHLTVPFVNSIWEIYFHPPEENMRKERVSLVQRFRMMNNRLLLQGVTQSFDKYGKLVSFSNWEEGKLHGRSQILNADGQVLEDQMYEYGVPVRMWKQFYATGKVAQEIEFPTSKGEWEETEVASIPYLERNLFSMSYHSPLTATEYWYDEDGIKIKEVLYNLYKDGHRYIVENTGKSKSFDMDGNVIQEADFSERRGTGTRKRVYSSLGVLYDEYQTWLSDDHFKSFNVRVER